MLMLKKPLYLLLFCFSVYNSNAQQYNGVDARVEPIKFKIQNNDRIIQAESKASKKEISTRMQSTISAEESAVKDFTSSANSGLFYLNSYNQLRNSFLRNDGVISSQEDSQLDTIAKACFEQTNGSFEANYLLLRQNRNTNEAYKYLREANMLSPNNSLLLLEKAWQAERIRNLEVRNSALRTAYNTGQISKFLVELSKWISNYAESNSLVITNGEHDTYPLWFNEPERNIKVLSLELLSDLNYVKKIIGAWDASVTIKDGYSKNEILKAILKSSKTKYFTWTVNTEILKANKDFLYPVGAMIAYSSQPMQNIKSLKTFYFDKAVAKYINTKAWSKDEFAPAMKNLIPGIDILLSSNSVTEAELNKLNELKRNIIEGVNQNSTSNGR